MNRRNGITLTEVLVTIFVMAIGLLAVLTLFPLAALNMAQAIVDDRVGHCAANAVAMANAWPDFLPVNDWGAQNVNNNRPNAGTADLFVHCQFGGPKADDEGPSYPIYIDPYGHQGGSSPTALGNTSTKIARLDKPWRYQPAIPPNYSPPNAGPQPSLSLSIPGGGLLSQYYNQGFVLQDDVMFDTDGTALNTGGKPSNGTLLREGRYSWAYMLRRPRAASAQVVDMQVVIYHQRSVYKNSAGSPETVVSVTGATLGGNAIAITPPSTATIRKGIWILDATTETAPGNLKLYGPVHANFYRVTNVSLQKTGQVLLDIQPPIKTPTMNHVVLMENVVDVFDRGSGWKMPYWRYDE
jgi:hypothetical protein